MEKSDIESLRKFYELAYQEDDSSAVVVVEYGEVDYTNNKTIKEFKENGYEIYTRMFLMSHLRERCQILGYMSETEAVNYAIDKFNRAVSRINRELLGYDINVQKASEITNEIKQ